MSLKKKWESNLIIKKISIKKKKREKKITTKKLMTISNR
jgi:hypothetical protein